MNKQTDLPNTSGFKSEGTSAQLFYLEIESTSNETPLESRAIPLNVLLNSSNNHFLVPVGKVNNEKDQVCVYVDPAEVDQGTLINYINSQKCFSVNGNSLPSHNNFNIEPSTSAPTTSNNPLVLSAKCNDQVIIDNLRIQNNCLSTLTGSDHNKTKEKKRIRGFVPILDRAVPARAIAVLPQTLHFRREYISPRRSLPQRVKFGPVQGLNRTISHAEAREMVQNAAQSKKPIFLLHINDRSIHIDVSDKDKSNWLGLLPLGSQCTANVWLYEEDNNLYGITVHSIKSGTPLALGYTKPYIQEHGLPEGQPVLDICEDMMEEPRLWWCYECQRSFSTSYFLRRHVGQCHTEDITVFQRKYRCRHCTRTYTRLGTLKRHMARYCTRRAKKLDNATKTVTAEDSLNTSLNMEDNRLPSDESLQNYTNGLDFSTSLFDTDRIPGLDISGSSRSETEFNNYGLTYRDENALTPDLGFEKLSTGLGKSQNYPNETREQTQETESMLISCPYCRQTILREKKRQHLNVCTEKRPECHCGRTFPNSDKLSQHIQTEHSDNTQSKTDAEESQSLGLKCEKCELSFKRRGMLVNHLWRVHRSRAPVPLERRVRHYPCAACPKLYRTAAKRNRHQAAHHPGVTTGGRYSIEGGRRCVSPAVCSVCPRQYATRAKLLQHVRQSHPEQAPPVKQSSKATSQQKSIPVKPAGS